MWPWTRAMAAVVRVVVSLTRSSTTEAKWWGIVWWGLVIFFGSCLSGIKWGAVDMTAYLVFLTVSGLSYRVWGICTLVSKSELGVNPNFCSLKAASVASLSTLFFLLANSHLKDVSLVYRELNRHRQINRKKACRFLNVYGSPHRK